MRIAYIVPYVPNLIRTRPYNLITNLASMGHEVVVFTVGSGKQDLIDAQTLEAKCREVHYHVQPLWRSLLNSIAAVLSVKPLQSVYSWQRSMALQIARRVSRQEFDIVHVEHLRGSRYGSFLKESFPSQPVVWDSVDCISHLFRQAASTSRNLFGKFVTRFELPRTLKAEGDLVCQFDHVLITSPSDRNALLELAPRGQNPAEVSVLPNGVDLDYFHPNSGYLKDPDTIVFSGKMSYHANIAMVKYLVAEIMPRIWKTRPTVRLYIVGKDPSREIKALGKNPLIVVTGTVDDIRPFLWRATVSVVPFLYGAGIQNKILEAMATRTPVVTTCGAIAGLQAKPGKDLLVANDVEGFSRAVLQLIEDQALHSTISDAGLTYVRAFHNWTSIVLQLLEIYERELGQKPS